MPSTIPPDAVHPLSRAEWRAWLARHHERGEGVWLVTFKKATGKPRIPYDEAVEEALCFGWIDSKPAKLDAERSMLCFAPRRPATGWSRPNKERVERMVAAGLMQPAGLAKVEQAMRDGSWSRLDAVEALEVPPDLIAALAAYPNAGRHFEAFPRSAKRGILEWILTARRAETRARRIAETAHTHTTHANRFTAIVALVRSPHRPPPRPRCVGGDRCAIRGDRRPRRQPARLDLAAA